ncbi:MAG: STAS/SEC14 domain-containing protein [Bdellovibrionota bacterium]
MIQFKQVAPEIVELDFSGEITGEDYKSVKPDIEKVMAAKGKVKFLMDLTQAKGFNLGAVYQDIKFDIEHFKNIGATAVIASKKTYEYMVKSINMIYPEKVYHFEEAGAGLSWLKSQG